LTTVTRATEDLVWEVRRLFRELGQAADAVLAPLGVTAAERALLEFLSKEREPITPSEIARKRSVSRQHIHQTLSRLDQEWIDRSADSSDARAISLSLSGKGRRFWSRIRVADGELLERIEKVLPAREARSATATLRKIREALSSRQEERQ
jgi:DNA-binding MarR family transcriptional regulator